MNTAADTIDSDRVGALAALLDRDAPDAGRLLPAMWQVAFFLPRPAQHELAPDGHPRNGFPAPPRPQMRRMFAGGRLDLNPGLRIGEPSTAATEVVGVRETTGRNGSLTFMTVRTEVSQGTEVRLVDERDIVYLPPSGESPIVDSGVLPSVRTLDSALRDYDLAREVLVDETLLFRFSALTYNAHRIHYDYRYATQVEGYPGLVVHGPLQALLMAEAASAVRDDRSLRTLSYQLVAPLFIGQGLHLAARKTPTGAHVEVLDSAGRTTARADAAVEL